jgi:hypothetical protein
MLVGIRAASVVPVGDLVSVVLDLLVVAIVFV